MKHSPPEEDPVDRQQGIAELIVHISNYRLGVFGKYCVVLNVGMLWWGFMPQ